MKPEKPLLDGGGTLTHELGEKPLFGKIALITGASRGIGASMAIELARNGAAIVGPHRDGNPGKVRKANKVIAEVEGVGGQMISPVIDITDPEQRQQLVQQIINDYGQLDILILNAAGGLGPEWTEEEARAINVTAPLELTRELLPNMPRGSKVIGIPSLWSYLYGRIEPLPDYELVAKTKHEGEKALRHLIPQLEEQGVTLGFVCGHAIEDTLALRIIRRQNGDVIDSLLATAEGETLPKRVDMANAALKLATTTFPPGYVEFVGVPNWDKNEIEQKLQLEDHNLRVDRMVFFGNNRGFGYFQMSDNPQDLLLSSLQSFTLTLLRNNNNINPSSLTDFNLPDGIKTYRQVALGETLEVDVRLVRKTDGLGGYIVISAEGEFVGGLRAFPRLALE